MTHRLRPALALLCLLGTVHALIAARPAAAAEMGPRLGPAQNAAADDGSQARVIVRYRSDSALMRPHPARPGSAVRPQHAGLLGQRLGLPLQDGRVLGERMQALRGQGLSSTALAARLAQQADVEWAVVDERRHISALPNDPYYGPNQTSITPAVGQWYLRAPAGEVVSSINAPGAWAITHGSANVTVAVLDTGVRYDHPDLAGKLHTGYDFVSDSISAGDGGGRDSDATDPGDWSTAGECGRGSSAGNSSWHGTQTAGLVGAATDNNLGIASIGRNVMVLPVRVLGKCGGSDSDIIAGMYWAAGLSTDSSLPPNPHPAQVISMSLGKSGSCPRSYQDVFTALANAGVTVVVAAGNDAGLAVSAPGNCAGALAVTGLRHVGSKVGFASIGPQVAIAAPGGNCVNTSGPCLYPMMTTINLGTTTPSSNGYSDSTNYSVGTSFATPLVAGVVGLMLSVDPTLKPAAIRSALQATARPFPTTGSGAEVVACKAPSNTEQLECYCTTSTCGAGMLDAAAVLAAVTPAAIAPPSAVITGSDIHPTAGQSVTLSAASSSANGGRSLATYQWQITGGTGQAAFSGPTTGSTATLVTSGAGTVTVALTVTDSGGASGSSSATVDVQATATAPQSSSGGGGGGGGAMSVLWIALLGLASATLQRSRR